MIPIRCISCGKPVSAYFDEYNRRLADGEESKEILDDIISAQNSKTLQEAILKYENADYASSLALPHNSNNRGCT